MATRLWTGFGTPTRIRSSQTQMGQERHRSAQSAHAAHSARRTCTYELNSRDPVQGIGGVYGFLAKRIGDVSEASGGIENALGFPIERIFDRDQIAQLIRERGDVREWIGDRERLALGIHGEGRRLAQRIGDGREISLRIIAERGGVAQGVGDRGDLIEGRFIGERDRDGIGRPMELRDGQYVALAIIGIGGLAVERVGDTEEEIRRRLPFIGRRLCFGLTVGIGAGECVARGIVDTSAVPNGTPRLQHPGASAVQ